MPSSHRPYSSQAMERARELRHEMTPQERHLWYDFLRPYRPKFYRQRPIGPYIADFVCPLAALVVELDGGQHYDEEHLAYDEQRTKYLLSQGYRVLRLINTDVNRKFETICEFIDRAVHDSSLQGQWNSESESAQASPSGGGAERMRGGEGSVVT